MARKYKIARISCGCGNCTDTNPHAGITLYASRDEEKNYQISARQGQPRPGDECWDIDTPHDTHTLEEVRDIIAAWYSSAVWNLQWWYNRSWKSD